MYVVVVHHMDDADLMDYAGSMEEGDFSPLQVYIIFLCLWEEMWYSATQEIHK